MNRNRVGFLGVTLSVVLVASLMWTLQSQDRSGSPVYQPLEYRVGAYFPEGFPLEGQVRLLSSPVVQAGKRERVRIEYLVGKRAIEPGMRLEVWKHFTSDVEGLQVVDPEAPAHFSVDVSSAEVKTVTQVETNWVQRNSPSVFPYRKTAFLEVVEGALKEGDRVTFDLGGRLGVRMQHYQENLFNFRIAITKEKAVLGYGGDALMRVTGGPLRALRVQAPSVVKIGEEFEVAVLPRDDWGSLAVNHMGLSLRITEGKVSGGDFFYKPSLEHYVAGNVVGLEEGVLRIRVETQDGQYRGISNPIWVQRYPRRRVYFGELHQHSYLADGRGVFEELYLYGRKVGLLDFGALTSHHTFIVGGEGPSYHLEGKKWPRDNWPAIEAANAKLNGWQNLVTILGYEYSVGTKAGGHHNVYYNADEAPTTMHLDPNNISAPVAQMLRTLALVRKPTLVIPHIGGGPPDWSHPTDQQVERLFEVASVHGVFEESYFKHLENGLRVGAIAAGDTHTAAMGNAYPGINYTMTNGLAGVYASGKTRDEIWDGLSKRSSFAVTGNLRPVLDFRVNGEPMGGEIASGLATKAKLEAKVSGTAPLTRVQLFKNLKVVYTIEPAVKKGNLVRVTWGDNIYQRRAAVGRTQGELRPENGSLRLEQPVHRDQAFEIVQQDGNGIKWNTAAVSGDRDGFLMDLSEVDSGVLRFKLDDSSAMGVIDVEIPVEQLRQDGRFTWSKKGSPKVEHSYMKQMGLEPEFFLELLMVEADGDLDIDITYLDPEAPKSGDFYMLKMEQLDTNKAWSSPVWVN